MATNAYPGDPERSLYLPDITAKDKGGLFSWEVDVEFGRESPGERGAASKGKGKAGHDASKKKMGKVGARGHRREVIGEETRKIEFDPFDFARQEEAGFGVQTLGRVAHFDWQSANIRVTVDDEAECTPADKDLLARLCSVADNLELVDKFIVTKDNVLPAAFEKSLSDAVWLAIELIMTTIKDQHSTAVTALREAVETRWVDFKNVWRNHSGRRGT
eukprot:SAG22_NODE_625_length_8437_cov_5.263133_10_plen_217_part_00